MKRIDFNYLENLESLLRRVIEKKKKVDAARPLPAIVMNRIREDLSLEWTYNSNGIEGNSLTLIETKVVLEEGMTIGGKSLHEHFEVLNHEKAIQYLEEIVSPKYNIRAIDFLNIHGLILKNIDDDYAGRIRNGVVRITGANFTPPSPGRVSRLLDDLVMYVNSNPDSLMAPVLATIFHHQFVYIHPFFDGNGRTARLAMNLILMKAGYPPCIILKNDRKKYYAALNQANNNKYEKLTLMVLQGIERSLNIYLNVLPDHHGEYESLSSIVEDPAVPYGLEYVSLLARRGKINAHKEGRNWVSTKEDVIEYAQQH